MGLIPARPGRRRPLGLALLAGALSGCGGVSAPTPSGSPVADVPPIVTITASGASPRDLHIFAKDVATFVNRDGQPHDVRADPRLNSDVRCNDVFVGLLQPGQSQNGTLQPSGIACFYRDERDPSNASLQGYVLTHY